MFISTVGFCSDGGHGGSCVPWLGQRLGGGAGGDVPPDYKRSELWRKRRVLRSLQLKSHVQPSMWWHLLVVSQGGDQGLDPSHLYSCRQSLLVPVIPLTLPGMRISPASETWHPASYPSLGVFVELPVLSLTFLPKTSCSSRAFVLLIAQPGSAEFLFLAKHPSIQFSHGVGMSESPRVRREKGL